LRLTPLPHIPLTFRLQNTFAPLHLGVSAFASKHPMQARRLCYFLRPPQFPRRDAFDLPLNILTTITTKQTTKGNAA